MMRSRFSRPRFLNAQNSYAAYLAVSALLDVLLESEGAFFKTTYLDFFGAYLDGHPLRFNNQPQLGLESRLIRLLFSRCGSLNLGGLSATSLP